ncbi:uncharacterized protein LOC119678093 isoform X1 [Teleopsis dalmanni]|uniref:uncharacterized protein LOC119678093 isoform X1 n=1 Tax=Teleopsis dalmanni TaxID=139649 RepID=UPI0018CF318A|nr:uncharacterized protein LOC119678093 isoform X1 [Teleopsis dalmanni]
MQTKNFKLLNILVLLSIGNSVLSDEYNQEEWIEPNAWGREASLSALKRLNDAAEDDVCLKCKIPNINNDAAVCPVSDNTVALLLFKKFVKNLFQRNKFEFDEFTSLYKRSLEFTIKAEQLEKLENLNDPRDLDTVLTEVFANVRNVKQTKSSLTGNDWLKPFLNFLKDYMHLLHTSETQFLLIAIATVIFGRILHKRYKIGVFVIILGVVFLSGYVITYLECNRELENTRTIAAIKNIEEKEAVKDVRWYNPISWFGKKEETLSEKIMKTKKIHIKFCRPDHVLLMYFNDLLLKQLQFVIEKCTDTMAVFRDKLPFGLHYFADILLLVLLGYLIKLTFKYILSPRAWSVLLHRPKHQSIDTHPPHLHGLPQLTEDRISGENLKLLLNAISNTPNINNGIQQIAAASGVEEVQEMLEAPTRSSSKSNSPNSTIDQIASSEVESNVPCIDELKIDNAVENTSKIKI